MIYFEQVFVGGEKRDGLIEKTPQELLLKRKKGPKVLKLRAMTQAKRAPTKYYLREDTTLGRRPESADGNARATLSESQAML